MKTVVVACETIRHELEQAMINAGVDDRIIWLESGLHAVPANLNRRLKEVLSKVEEERVLLAMGFCGNAVVGLKADHFQLIVPRADDCITLLLGSWENRQEVSRKYAAYFLTKGWLRGERNILVEYQYMMDKYGEKQAKEIGKMMYSHYRTLALLDTGVESIEELQKETMDLAGIFGWKQQIVPATLKYLERLLTGPWDSESFIVKNPGESIETKDLYMQQ